MKFSLALLCFANLLLFLVALLLNNILAKLDLNGGAGVNRTRSTGCVRNGDADIGLHLSTGGHWDSQASLSVDVLALKLRRLLLNGFTSPPGDGDASRLWCN